MDAHSRLDTLDTAGTYRAWRDVAVEHVPSINQRLVVARALPAQAAVADGSANVHAGLSRVAGGLRRSPPPRPRRWPSLTEELALQ